VPQQDSERTFDRLVYEGQQRLGRSWSGFFPAGFLGGLGVGVGVLALLLVESATHNVLLGGLAFSIGFIALTLARSELFTEDFLVPVAAVVAKDASPLSLGRLWTATLATNLAGGWVVTTIVMAGFPALRSTAVEAGRHYIELDAGQVNHAIVGSLICFAALQAGAPFGYADWLGMFAFAALGNMIGGLGLVTLLRLLQVPHKVLAERQHSGSRTSGRKVF
jgi:formate-nitrite transporter family protein